MKHLSYLKKFFWIYRWRFLLGILFVGLANVFRVWQPKVIGQALDTVVDRVKFYKEHGGISAHPEAFDELGTQIAWFGAAVIGLALLMGLFMFFMRQTIIVMSRLIEYDMRKEIFYALHETGSGFLQTKQHGRLDVAHFGGCIKGAYVPGAHHFVWTRPDFFVCVGHLLHAQR